MVLLSVDKDMRTTLDYGTRPDHKGRRWFLVCTCRETGCRETAKFITKPNSKQVRRFKGYARVMHKHRLYWDEF